MLLVQHHHVIQTLASDASDEELDIGILPRRPRGNYDLFHAHMSDALPEMFAVDAVAIAEEIAWRLVPGKRLYDLLGGPLRSRMLGDIEMHDATAVGRPGVPCWLRRHQWSRNRCRCQAMTVCGWTNDRAACQPGHIWASQGQNTRSDGQSRGRWSVCLYTAS